MQEFDAAMGHYNKAIELDPTVDKTSPSSSKHLSLILDPPSLPIDAPPPPQYLSRSPLISRFSSLMG